ncbi:hypothetical protein [Faecalibacterium taiwanense]
MLPTSVACGYFLPAVGRVSPPCAAFSSAPQTAVQIGQALGDQIPWQ